MPSPVVHVAIDASQFPDRIANELGDSLRERKINHKFHYESHKQAQKWLALRRAYSPYHADSSGPGTYVHSFHAAIACLAAQSVHVVGLGCGGGEKDCELLTLLESQGKESWYSPVDVSTSLVITAHELSTLRIDPSRCQPIVCDLLKIDDLPGLLGRTIPENMVRIFTFFGMIPNFEPPQIMSRLAGLLRKNDLLLFSANLAPGPDYEAGLRKILPQYDNVETRDWLMTFLLDLGVDSNDGELHFDIESISDSLKGVVARFRFKGTREIQAAGERFMFQAGDTIRLFFSCRHTPEIAQSLLGTYRLKTAGQWLSDSKEEGIFLAQK